VCADGFYGLGCESNEDEFLGLQQTRHQIVEAIKTISLLDDITAESLKSWLERLAVVCNTPVGLLDETKIMISDLAIEFMAAAQSLGLPYEDVESVSTTLDLVLSAITSGGSSAPSQLLDAYGAFIANDMVQGQNGVVITNTWFRLATYAGDGDSIVTHETPQTILEQAGDKSAQSVTVPGGTGSAGYKLSLVELLIPSANSSSFMSSPLGLRFDQLPCNASSDVQTNCSVLVTLQNWSPLSSPYYETNFNESDATVIDFTCSANRVENLTTSCDNGFNVSVYCNGTAGVILQKCPQVSHTSVCRSIGRDSSPCELVSFSSTNITCECNVGAGNVRRRRLQDSGATESDDSSISVDFTSAGESVFHEFVSTWGSVDELSARDVFTSIHVLVTMSVIGIVSIVLVLLAWREDVKDIKKEKEMKEVFRVYHRIHRHSSKKKKKVPHNLPLLSTKKYTNGFVSPVQVKMRDVQSRREIVQGRVNESTRSYNEKHAISLLNSSLPSVMQPLPMWVKYKDELKAYHRWGGIYFHYSAVYTRPLRMLSLITNIIIFLFVEAVTYELADPDDGSCEELKTLSTCLSEKSSFDSSESKCYWDINSSGCEIREVDNSLMKVMLVAIFASIIGTPFVALLQVLIQKNLAAETLIVKKISPSLKDKGNEVIMRRAFVRGREGTAPVEKEIRPKRFAAILPVHTADDKESRRISLFDSDGKLILSNTAHEELPLLFADVQQYRTLLSREDCKVFDETWGFNFDESNNFLENMSNLINKLFRKAFKKHSDSVELVLIAELQRVHEVVSAELFFFGRKDIPESLKNKRLTYLFVKDLLSSANGKILENKYRRDNTPRRKVSYLVKLCTWVFITLVLAAMLFYIYLFALRQTASRQKAWFFTFLVWVMFEILLVSSALVFFQHVIVPSYILNDLKNVRAQIVKDIVDFKSKLDNRIDNKRKPLSSSTNNRGAVIDIADEKEKLIKEANQTCEFNAAKYLYVSHRLARSLPDLPISINVLQFSTPWPNQSLKENNKMSDNYNAKFTFVGQSLSKVMYFVLLGLISVPEPVQDALVEIVSTSGLGYLVVLCIQIYAFSPFLAFAPIMFLAVCTHFIIQSSKKSSILSKDTPKVSPDVESQGQTRIDNEMGVRGDQTDDLVRNFYSEENDNMEKRIEHLRVDTQLRSEMLSYLEDSLSYSIDSPVSPPSHPSPLNNRSRRCRPIVKTCSDVISEEAVGTESRVQGTRGNSGDDRDFFDYKEEGEIAVPVPVLMAEATSGCDEKLEDFHEGDFTDEAMSGFASMYSQYEDALEHSFY
jgi:hypothetical protein